MLFSFIPFHSAMKFIVLDEVIFSYWDWISMILLIIEIVSLFYKKEAL